MKPDVLANMVPLRKAARQAGKRVDFIRKLVDEGHLPAYRDGGSDAAPRLKVDPREIGPAILRATRHVPDVSPRLRTRPGRRPAPRRGRPTHPDVEC